MTAWGGEGVRAAQIRGGIAAVAFIGLVVLMVAVVRASMDPGPPVGNPPRESVPPITVRLTVPVFPPRPTSPYGPR